MAKPELSLIEERDETQRALGCVGLSAFAHVGLLIMILFAPSLRETAGVANGTTAGIELPGEPMADAAAAGLPQSQSQPTSENSGPVEVMLADANDASAVALPNSQPEAAQETPPVTAEAVPQTPPPAAVAKVAAKPKAAKPVVESQDISSALTQARVEAAKAPMKPAKLAAHAPQVETSEASEVAAPVAETEDASEEETSEQPVATAQANQAGQADDEEESEAVPLQVALPEDESLTQAQANALQAPNANTSAIPADAKPIESVQSVRTNNAPTGMVVTRPANSAPVATANQAGLAARGLPTSQGATGSRGTISGATQSRGGTAGIGVPAGAQVRDARSLEAMPGNPLATYPLPDRMANREGTTVLLGHVRNDGRVEQITLEKSSGSRLMDESAAKAFSQWKYKPGQEGYVRLPMQFKLVGDAHVIPAELQRQ